MDPQIASQVTPWITPAMLLAGFVAVFRSLHRLEDRSSARLSKLDERLNVRIGETERRLNARMDEMEGRLNTRMDEMEGRLNTRMDALDVRMDKVEGRLRTTEHTQANILGQMTIIREALQVRRPDAASASS